MERNIVDDLYAVILDRKKNPRDDSYTSKLFSKGKDEILKKIGEEVIEVIVASKGLPKQQVIHELADLLYHCLVLMAHDDIKPEDVYKELEKRFGK